MKKEFSYMKAIVILVLLQVFLYTWAHLYLSYRAGVEIAPTVSHEFYKFCGLEAGILGALQTWKSEWIKRLAEKVEGKTKTEDAE